MTAFRAAILYAIGGALWILASDALVGLVVADPGILSAVQTLKGLLFIGATALLIYLLLRGVPSRRAGATATQASARAPLLLFAVLVAGAAGAGYTLFQHQKDDTRGRTHEALDAIADLKAGLIEAWLTERRNDAQVLAVNPFIVPQIQKWLERGAPADEIRDRLHERFDSMRSINGYPAIFLFDAQGRTALTSGIDESAGGHARRLALEAMRTRELITSDLHRGEGGVELDIMAPLVVGDAVVGALYFRIDPEKTLFSLIQGWLTPSPSAETMLVRREGDDLLYLNELRHRKGTALRLRLPVSGTGLPAAQEREGVFEGTDYRGVPVLGAIRKVGGTPWFLVAKVDRDEAYARIRQHGAMTAALVAVFALAAAAVSILWWRQRTARHDAERYRIELQRRQAEEEMQQAQTLLAHALSVSPAVIYVLRPDPAEPARFIPVFASETVREVTGYDPEEWLKTADFWASHLHPDDRSRALENQGVLLERGTLEHEYRFLHKDGSWRWIDDRLVLKRDADGKPTEIVGAWLDITTRKTAEEQIKLAAQVFENSAEGILVTDRDGAILSVNRAFTTVTGYAAEEAIGRNPSLLKSDRHDRPFYQNMWKAIIGTGYWQGEIWNRRKNGETYPEWLTITAVRDRAGEITRYIGIFSDISEHKADEARIHYLAEHDALTGLPNRVLLADRLALAISGADRTGRGLAVLLLDLDHFKTINDSLGHQTGDRLLQAVAERLAHTLRASDTVARQGGDEFVVLLPELEGADDAARTAEKLLQALAPSFRLNGYEFGITTSIGISLYPENGRDAETLLKNADAAMYHAKESGRNGYQFFTAEMDTHAFNRLAMENGLRQALQRQEFLLHYQPQVDLESGAIVGTEALIRWRHPELGLVSPARFIPVAEESGIILQIGEWVLREACRQNRAWQDEGLPALPVAVNLSALQFRQKNLQEMIGRILEETGLEPRYLELELTESMVMHEAEAMVEKIRQLKDMGLKLSIDDFGTGYSSLNYLKRFPIDKLKIDQSFVRDIPGDPDDAAIVRAVISLARSLRLRMIAEGVETPEQLEFLRAENCQEMQGYYFSKPLPAEEFGKLLAEGRRLS